MKTWRILGAIFVVWGILCFLSLAYGIVAFDLDAEGKSFHIPISIEKILTIIFLSAIQITEWGKRMDITVLIAFIPPLGFITSGIALLFGKIWGRNLMIFFMGVSSMIGIKNIVDSNVERIDLVIYVFIFYILSVYFLIQKKPQKVSQSPSGESLVD